MRKLWRPSKPTKRTAPDPTVRLKARIARLLERLATAEGTLEAIHLGHVDALVVQGPDGDQIFTLEGADHRYRQLVETMNEGALLLDVEGIIVYANARFAQLVKTPLDALIGTQFRRFVPEAWLRMVEALLKARGGSNAEVELLAGLRARVPVYISSTAGWDVDMQLTYLMATDLTHQRRSQETIAAERLATLIVDQAAEGIVVCDLTGKVIRASNAAHRVAGENPLLRQFADVFRLRTADDADVAPTIVASALRGEVTSGLEVTLNHHADAETTLLLSAGPILAAEGAPLGCVLSFVDVTDRKRVAQERQVLLEGADAARIAAETANIAKDEFLAMLGHELRNPLAPILTAVALMRIKAGDVFERERGIIERQVHHVVSLVEDLLDVSRITQGKVKLECAPIELALIVSRAIELASPLLEARGHRLAVDVPEGLVIDADATRMCQVVTNLLTNAAKFTEHGGDIAVTGTTGTGSGGGPEIVLTVRDSGIGIAPALLANVFETFVQGSRSSARSEGGLGLGLAIVRSLVLLHGGLVSGRSGGPGKGSEFELRLPPSLRSRSGAQQPVAQPHVESAVRPRRVLVVDDNEDGANLLSEALSALGHTTRVAHDGPSALSLAATFRPEIALLDIGLPVMDGYELARRLRTSDTAVPGLRLLAMTGYGQESDRRSAREAGFDDHMTKPIDFNALAALIERTA